MTLPRALLASSVSCGVALLAPAGANAAGGCITKLPVRVQAVSPFAQSYTSSMDVDVTASGGASVRRLRVALFTFGGERLGVGTAGGTLRGTSRVRLKLRFPMQVGKYTLVATGEPNANRSCGPKKALRVLKLRGCDAKLPINFPMLPGGTAADYRDTLSFSMRSSGGTLLRNLQVTVSSFSGLIFGSTTVSALFGELGVNIPLSQTLVSGGYSIYVQGKIPGEPPSCGPTAATAILHFA